MSAGEKKACKRNILEKKCHATREGLSHFGCPQLNALSNPRARYWNRTLTPFAYEHPAYSCPMLSTRRRRYRKRGARPHVAQADTISFCLACLARYSALRVCIKIANSFSILKKLKSYFKFDRMCWKPQFNVQYISLKYSSAKPKNLCVVVPENSLKRCSMNTLSIQSFLSSELCRPTRTIMCTSVGDWTTPLARPPN